MTSPHLPEPALQAAAESLAYLPAAQAAHLHACAQCQRQVAAYRQLYAATAQLPAPAFHFDLAASVVAQLPARKPAVAWALGLVAVLVVGVLTVFTLLFGGVLAQAMQGVFTVLGIGLGLGAGIFLAGQCLELLARHRRQMRLLAFS